MTTARQVLDMTSTVIVAGAAIIVAFMYVRNTAIPGATTPANASILIDTWQADNALGIRIGAPSAPIVITEFMDFQCPFCRRLAPRVDSLLTEYPDHVAVIFQHYPLTGHSYALPAAIAAECADRQGRFHSMYKALFDKQDLLGKKSFPEYAVDAGVEDLHAFERCVMLPADSFPRIQHGLDIGARAGVRGTPTVWVNGKTGRFNPAAIRSQIAELSNGG